MNLITPKIVSGRLSMDVLLLTVISVKLRHLNHVADLQDHPLWGRNAEERVNLAVKQDISREDRVAALRGFRCIYVDWEKGALRGHHAACNCAHRKRCVTKT